MIFIENCFTLFDYLINNTPRFSLLKFEMTKEQAEAQAQAEAEAQADAEATKETVNLFNLKYYPYRTLVRDISKIIHYAYCFTTRRLEIIGKYERCRSFSE